ncbi:hypothetical protein AB0A74_16235 [Saccharothrix sp. NPDC042600]|uniref:hypothetical protein n=1 Tax=Saccharothrix TaxID=2071 RepID=UPI0033C42444|nr:hypothetical protein GCM10017745_45670 [Saccharothrix mutabilis subsp. capreolus]
MDEVVGPEVLGSEECWEVLSAARTGNFLYTRHAMPMARPVPVCVWNRLLIIVMDATVREVVMRAGVGVAALQVDDVDRATLRGRSVNVHGEAGFLDEKASPALWGAAGSLPRWEDAGVYGYVVPYDVAGERFDFVPHGVGVVTAPRTT